MVSRTSQYKRQRSKFASSAFFVFVLGSATVLAFAIAERGDIISKFSESSARLAVCSLLLLYLISSARGLPRKARFGVYFCSAFLFAELVCEVIEDVDALDRLVLVGRASYWRHTVEKTLVACWTCGAFYLMYVLMRELEVAQAQIVKQERLSALGEMASGIAHDLNNALTPVVAVSSAILREESTPERRKLLGMIQSGAEHAAGVVKQLQHFYRTEKSDLELTAVDVAEVIQDAVELTHFKLVDEALKQGIRNSVQVNSQKDCFVIGNRTELVQVLSNLLMNAADAMPNGGCVTVSVVPTPDHVRIDVADDGLGMSREQHSRCFDPFYTTKPKGSGLGLSVCHGIIARHSGTIDVESKHHQGTKFIIKLPRVTQPRSPNACQNKQPPEDARILVIDDDESVRIALTTLLSPAGVDVVTAPNGALGLQAVRDSAYDLILTDLGMPGMTGKEVVSEVRNIRPEARIAVLSGWSRSAVSTQFRDQAAKPDFYLEKPVESHQTILRCLTESPVAADD